MFLSVILSSLRQWRHSRETARQLAAQTDRDLSDIGLSRSDIHQAARQGRSVLREDGSTAPSPFPKMNFRTSVRSWARIRKQRHQCPPEFRHLLFSLVAG